MANLLGAEFWPLSSKSGENVENFFRRIAVLAFETNLASDVKEQISRSRAQSSQRSQCKQIIPVAFPRLQVSYVLLCSLPAIIHDLGSEDSSGSARADARCASCKTP